MIQKSKKLSVLTLTCCMSISMLAINSTPVHAGTLIPLTAIPTVSVVQSDQLITPYSDITGWRYKSENGQVYRRLYNYSTQEWIGEWELC